MLSQLSNLGADIAKAVGIAAGIAVGGAAYAFASFEDAFADVRKTVEGTDEELNKISRELRELATQIPIDVRELSELAGVAGQLGIAADDITEFTRVAALLGVTTELSSRDAAEQLARLATIARVPKEDFEELASVLVDLGNKFNSTEGQILKVAVRIAGATQIIGISAQETLGIANAFASVVGPQGIEAAGTAIQKTMLAMNKAVIEGNKDLASFARVAGLSTEEFAELFEKDAAEAFTKFVEGLGKQGKKAAITLSDLGLKDARLIRTFLQMANRADELRRSMSTANEEFANANALADESNKRFATMVSQLQLLKNQMFETGITLGETLAPAIIASIKIVSDSFDDLLAIMDDGFKAAAGVLPDFTRGLIETIKGLGDAASGMMQVFAGFGEEGFEGFGGFLRNLGKEIGQFERAMVPAFETLGAEVADLNQDIAEAFRPLRGYIDNAYKSIAGGVSSVIEGVSDSLSLAMPEFTDQIVRILNTLGPAIKAFSGPLGNFVVGFIERVLGLIELFTKLAEVAGPPILNIIGSIFSVIGQAATQLAQELDGDLGVVLQDLASALMNLIGIAGGFLVTLLSTVVDVLEQFLPVLAGVLTALEPVIFAIGGALITVLQTAAPILAGFLEALAPVMPLIAGLVEAIGLLLVEALRAAEPILLTLVTEVLPVLAGLFTDVLTSLRESGLLDAISKLAVDLLPILVKAFSEIVDALLRAGFLETVAELAQTLFPALVEALTNIVTELVDSGALDSLAQLVVVLAELATVLVEELGPQGIQTLTDFAIVLTELATVVADILSGVIGDLIEKIISSRDGVKKGTSALADLFDLATGLLPVGQLTKPLHRQHGGPVRRGFPYFTGEAGPELFIPSQNGQVLSNDTVRQLVSALGTIGGRGGSTIHVYEVANDPEATARAVDARLGQGAD